MHKEVKKAIVGEWIGITLTWIVALYFYYLLIYWTYGDYLLESPLKTYLSSYDAHLEIILSGLFFGLLFSFINTRLDQSKLNRKSLGVIVIFKSLLYITAFAVTLVLVLIIFKSLGLPRNTSFNELTQYLSSKSIAALGIYILFWIVLINFIKQVSRKFGPGIFVAMISGKYHTPKDEDRIFLFIDLKDSTKLAEALGHKNYSQLLRACFYELNQLIYPYQAQIYQYVGDEAVLTWPTQKGILQLKCINLFFDFLNRLEKKRSYFEKKYNVIPSFKAGLDVGIVTVTEIGEIKREIAYHGDVLNTTSRIEGLCNAYNARLITTEHFVNRINGNTTFNYDYIDQVQLKGKQENLKLYKVSPSI